MPAATRKIANRRRRSAGARLGRRAGGMREIRIFVPDVRRPGFAADIRRQSLRIARGQEEAEISAWLDAVRDTRGWTYGAAT